MANIVGPPRGLAHLVPDAIFLDFCHYLTYSSLCALKDFTVRDQVKHKAIPVNSTAGQSDKLIVIKGVMGEWQATMERYKLYQELISQIPLPQFADFRFPKNLEVSDIESMVQNTHNYYRFLRLENALESAIINHLSSLADGDLIALMQTADTLLPTKTKDHFLALVTQRIPHRQDVLPIVTRLKILCPEFDNKMVTAVGRHYIQIQNSTLFAPIVSKCPDIEVLRTWLNTLLLTPWNQTIFVNIASSPLWSQLRDNLGEIINEKLYSVLIQDPHFNHLVTHAQTSEESHLFSEEQWHDLLKMLIFNNPHLDPKPLISHLLRSYPDCFQRYQPSVILLLTLIDHNYGESILPLLPYVSYQEFLSGQAQMASYRLPIALFCVWSRAVSKQHNGLVALITQSPVWQDHPKAQELVTLLDCGPLCIKYHFVPTSCWLGLLERMVVNTDFGRNLNQEISLSGQKENSLEELHGISFSSLIYPEFYLPIFKQPAFIQYCSGSGCLPLFFKSAIAQNLLFEESTLLVFFSQDPLFSPHFSQFLQAHPNQLLTAITHVAKLFLAKLPHDELMKYGIPARFKEEHIPNLVEQFIHYQQQEAIPSLLFKHLKLSPQCLGNLRAQYKGQTEIYNLLFPSACKEKQIPIA